MHFLNLTTFAFLTFFPVRFPMRVNKNCPDLDNSSGQL